MHPVRQNGAVRSRTPSLRSRAAFFVCALVAACAPAAQADTGTTPAPAPCVAAGAIAVVQPGATSAVAIGPSVLAAVETGTSAATFRDPDYDVALADVQVGAAGCVGGAGPGGTSTRVGTWSVLGGAVAGQSLRADLVPASGDGSSWHLRAKVTGLTVAGTPARAIAGASIAVSDWAVLDVPGRLDGGALQPFRWWAAAFELRLLKAHAGLPAGTRILIGYAAGDRQPAPLPAPPPGSSSTAQTGTSNGSAPAKRATAPSKPPTAHGAPSSHATSPSVDAEAAPAHAGKARAKKAAKAKATTRKKAGAKNAGVKKRRAQPTAAAAGEPLRVTPPLGLSGYVFPVAGRTSWGDTYGAARSDVPGGWHHGDDLFAQLGTPVVAVTDGTVFSIGWNRVGGWRLWLLDARGNEFYYAHLSGYTALASNDRHVRRGQVLGFVGNTGDAFTTWPHLHFEIHPNPLLYLGYDGAVDPTRYLSAWPRATHVVVPPPVRLPGAAPPGRGSLVDFRKLLALHPLKSIEHAAASTTPAPSPRPGPAKAPGATEVPVAAAPPVLDGPGAASRLAAPAVASGRGPTRGDGPAALVAAALIMVGAGVALVHTARSGRSS